MFMTNNLTNLKLIKAYSEIDFEMSQQLLENIVSNAQCHLPDPKY